MNLLKHNTTFKPDHMENGFLTKLSTLSVPCSCVRRQETLAAGRLARLAHHQHGTSRDDEESEQRREF